MQGQAALVTPPPSSARSASTGRSSQPSGSSQPSLNPEGESGPTPTPGVAGGKPTVPTTRPGSAGGYTNANVNKRTPISSSRTPKTAPRFPRGPTPLQQQQQQQGGILEQPREKKLPVSAAQLRAKHAEDRAALRQFMNQVKQRRREQGEATDGYDMT